MEREDVKLILLLKKQGHTKEQIMQMGPKAAWSMYNFDFRCVLINGLEISEWLVNSVYEIPDFWEWKQDPSNTPEPITKWHRIGFMNMESERKK